MTPRVAFTILLLLHVHVVCDIKNKAKKIKQAAIYFYVIPSCNTFACKYVNCEI